MEHDRNGRGRPNLDEWQAYLALPSDLQGACVIQKFTADLWYMPACLDALRRDAHDPAKLGQILTVCKQIGGDAWQLNKAIRPDTSEMLTACITTPMVLTMSSVQAEPVPWLWYPYLPRKALTLLDGDPGIGKSLLTCQLAASLSRGWPLPDQDGRLVQAPTTPMHTLFLAGEDSLTYTVRPRLDVCQADTDFVHCLTGVQGAEEEEYQFTFAHMQALRTALTQYQPALVVIDPVQAYMGPGIDMNRTNEVTPLLHALEREATAANCAILCVRHQAKASGQNGSKAMMRGLGSVAFTAVARSVLVLEQHPLDMRLALLAHAKTNISAIGRTQRFSKEHGQFAWAGVTRMDAEMFAGNNRGPDPHAFFEAFCWLEQRLEGGLAWPSADLEDEMLEHGFKKDTLRRAKKMLGVISKKTSAGGWTWRLPPLVSSPPPPYYNPITSLSLSTSVTTGTTVSLGNPIGYQGEGQDVANKQHTEDTGIPPRDRVIERGHACDDSTGARDTRVATSVPESCPQCGAADVMTLAHGRKCPLCALVIPTPTPEEPV